MTLTVVAGTRPPAELRIRTREPKPDFVEDADFASKVAMLNVRFAKMCRRVGDVLYANAAGVQVNDLLAKKNLSLVSEKRAKTFKLTQRTKDTIITNGSRCAQLLKKIRRDKAGPESAVNAHDFLGKRLKQP